MAASRKLSSEQREALLAALKTRFEQNMNRHEGIIDWAEVRARLEGDAGKLWSLHEMERTGGEPDIVGRIEATGELIFVDCSVESPRGRRSVCYDEEAREARKKHKPDDSAMEHGGRHGHRAADGGGVPEAPGARGIRHENLELGEDALPYPGARRSALL